MPLVDLFLQEPRRPVREVEQGDAEEEPEVAADLGEQRELRVEVVLLAHDHVLREVEGDVAQAVSSLK